MAMGRRRRQRQQGFRIAADRKETGEDGKQSVQRPAEAEGVEIRSEGDRRRGLQTVSDVL